MANFSFGQNKGLFGSSNLSAGGGLFGANITTVSGFGFGGTSSASFGFGIATPSQSSGFGNMTFGAVSTQAQPTGLFGASTNLFGAAGSSTFGQSGFGLGNTGAGFGGSGFNTAAGLAGSIAPGFHGAANNFKIGTSGAGGGLGFGSQITGQNSLQTLQTQMANLKTALTSPIIFGDERDLIIAKWNQLQACWGTGKGYFNQQGSYVDFTPDNPYSLFKAVGYSCRPTLKNSDGLVILNFSKSQSEVSNNQQHVVDSLHKLLGSRQNLLICVDTIRSLDNARCEITIYVQDRQPNGVTTRINATDLLEYLCQPNIKQQLSSQLCITDACVKVAMTEEQLKFYLKNPPSGIDPHIWEQAQLDNVDPTRLIPVPMIGFTELHSRLQHQEKQADMHQLRLEVISDEISSLKANLADIVAKTDEYKRRQVALGHRVLKILVRQEIDRKQGYVIQPEEEQLSIQLDSIVNELNAPTRFKGRLNELMSQIRMQNQVSVTRSDLACQIDSNICEDIKQHLVQQQKGIGYLVDILKEDMKDLKAIEGSLQDSFRLKR